MDSRKTVARETAVMALGQAVCIPLTALVFGLLGCYDGSVLPGAAAGALIALLNFFFMALGACAAADKARQQDVQSGQAAIRTSFLLRQVLTLAALVLCAKSGRMDPVALVVPLALIRPILTAAAFFRRKGEKTA